MRKRTVVAIIILLISSFTVSAQYVDSGLQGSGNTAGKSQSPSDTAENYSLKRYFNALAHRDSMSIGWSFGSSVILPGASQIYNRDYWKLPVIYIGIGGMIGGGIYYNSQYRKTGDSNLKLYSNLFFAGAALFYWGQLMDGAVCYESYRDHLPGRATVYSILFPGLGQMYNGEYWKLPIYYGGLALCGYLWHYNNMQFHRFKKAYNEATLQGADYKGSYSVENLKYYRDYYWRFRDYSIVATVAVYLLQIIDADVFATMRDIDINQSLTMGVEPALIEPINYKYTNNYASVFPTGSAVGFKLNLRF